MVPSYHIADIQTVVQAIRDMSSESDERELLIAAKAVEQTIISADVLAKAAHQWTSAGQGSLLSQLEAAAESDLTPEGLQQLRALFTAHQDAPAHEIAESIDDSVFGKLNGALANVDHQAVKAVAGHWTGESGLRPPVSEYDRFRIISEHARGGLGEVLLAQDRQLNRQVALKRIRDKWADNNNARIRFQLEAEITGRLEHPGVVPVYALGHRPDGQIYYAMRFIRGESLEAALTAFHDASAQLPPDRRSAWFRSAGFRDLLRRFLDVCNTIGYAHSRGIIHRDLKPANIMLGRYGETLVVDWGLAKQVGSAETPSLPGAESLILSDSGSGSAPTQFGSAVGTPQYMSPEQATGRLDRMGPPTDVFGLGATLYHLLTGQPPQGADPVPQILERVEHGDFPAPSQIRPDVPRPLEAICLKAMARRPAERYASPGDMAGDVERWLADEPVEVCRDSPTVRAMRWVRKNQTIAATTAVAMILLTIASVVGSFVWSQFEHQQLQYEQAQLRQQAEERERERARLSELRTSLATTQALVRQQLADGQLAMAVSVLEAEIGTLAAEPEFADEQAALKVKADRLKRITEFYRLTEAAQQANYLAQDEDEIIATVAALELLGIWKHADWWNHLPVEDLNAAQHDQLQQAVYRALVLLASTYTKLTGLRTLGGGADRMPETMSERLGAIFSQGGKDEARATLAITDMAIRFQYAESLRWYRGVAGLRLLKSTMVPSHRLKSPRNGADAYELGILLLTRAITGDFPFDRYRGLEDDLMNARETLGIASEMAPDHYWTHLLLAQAEYLLAERATDGGDTESWRYYETTQQTFGRCIALWPESPFAYADLSTVCLRQKEVISNSTTLSEADVTRLQQTLLDSCVRYALQAVERAPQASWVYWHYGHALAAVGRTDDAMEAYSRAIQLGYRFSEDSNATLIDVDRIRGRTRVIEETKQRITDGDHRSVCHAIVAAAHLMVRDIDEARPFAVAACAADDVHPLAWSTRGLIALHDGQPEQAASCFSECRRLNPRSLWAAMGLGMCHEQLNNPDQAALLFQQATELSETDYHAADAAIGLCRQKIRLGQQEQAANLIKQARATCAACSLNTVEALAKELDRAPLLAVIEQSRPMSTTDIIGNETILNTSDVPVRNGGFELPPGRYWQNPGAPAWHASGPEKSTATIDFTTFHSGLASLHIQSPSQTDHAASGTQQTITVEEDTTCRITVWAKSAATETGALKIVVTREDAPPEISTIEFPPGEYDWQQLSGKFSTPTSRRNRGFAPMTVHLICTGAANLWIDDIVITELTE
ncbi:MAG: protein kinase [Fuerstiella sp.]